jgi:hypothetical protein
MKKLNFNKIIPITLLIVFQSCIAIHGGYMTNSASLSTNNFQYVKYDAQGTATVTYIFGIGGNLKMALVNEAKKNLLENNPLLPNQTLANITVNWKTTFIGFHTTTRCIVTADIVEFNSSNESIKTNQSNETLESENKVKKNVDVLDVIFLKDGRILKGFIINKVPDLELTLQTKLGSKMVIKLTEIEKIMKSND